MEQEYDAHTFPVISLFSFFYPIPFLSTLYLGLPNTQILVLCFFSVFFLKLLGCIGERERRKKQRLYANAKGRDDGGTAIRLRLLAAADMKKAFLLRLW